MLQGVEILMNYIERTGENNTKDKCPGRITNAEYRASPGHSLPRARYKAG